MKVLFASAEVLPFAWTGGLGDVCRALPLALRDLGVEVEIAMPFYRMVRERGFSPSPSMEVTVPAGDREEKALVFRGDLEGVPVYFVGHDGYFNRPHLYGPPGKGYPDNAERFLFFTRALLSLGEAFGWPWDLVHCHDWHVALFPLLKGRKAPPLTLLTIHNIGYQGEFPLKALDLLRIPEGMAEAVVHRGKVNFLKGGIVTADLLTTVSPTYAREILTPEFGFGLEDVLREHSHKLHGILNGVDYRLWDPRHDPFIAAPYGPEDLSGKALCKEDLLRTLRLPEGLKARPLFGMVSRLVRQKGLDLLLPLIPRMMAEGVGLVVLGTGEERYEKGLRRLAAEHPAGMRVVIDFDEGLSHKIEAGCDLYLMPSLYEPCGLNQMYSLRYGTLPVVRDTGGLADTVEQADPRTGRGTGFKFRLFRPAYLWRAIRRGLRAYATPDLWGRLQRQAMTKDFSWRRSAEQYLKLYRRLCIRSG